MDDDQPLKLTELRAACPEEQSAFFARYEGEATVPAYAPATSAPIVHIGVSNFHRSHYADYLADLLQLGSSEGWSIHGAGLLPSDKPIIEALQEQGGAYSLLTYSPEGEVACKVLHPHSSVELYADDKEPLIKRIADPTCRIVSLTVTEGGYYLTEDRKALDLTNPQIVLDLESPTDPTTHIGIVVEALRRRWKLEQPGLTLLSCDNLQGNGDVLKTVVVTYAEAVDPTLAKWIADSVSFPNSMVDRITPRATDADVDLLRNRFGILDKAPVPAETYKRWVVEDSFTAGRPEWELSGAEIVLDVHPYEEMKLRLLNASHQTMAYVAYFLDHTFVDEALEDPRVLNFLKRFAEGESIGTMTAFDRDVYENYVAEVLNRFRNERLRDTIDRLCWPDYTMIQTFVAPIIQDRLAAAKDATAGLAVVVSWAAYVNTLRDEGRELDDPTDYVESLLGPYPDALEQWDNLYRLLQEEGIVAFLRFLEKN